MIDSDGGEPSWSVIDSCLTRYEPLKPPFEDAMNLLQLSVLCSLVAALIVVPVPAKACAPAPPRNVFVEIASESAIIVWDSATKTQHFIRRAAFQPISTGDVKFQDFGFLVPTPSQPVLEEVSDTAFDELAKVTAPKTETRKRPSDGGGGCGCSASKSSGEASKVEVLEAKHVAGYDAKILKATDTEALAAWLKEHEYEARPALMAWVKPYVEKGWIITAFKIARDKDTSTGFAIGSTAVRMSFTTDTPFFPYSEPADMKDAKTKRLLRVFFLSDKKMMGLRRLKSGTRRSPGLKLPAENAKAARTATPEIPGHEPGENTWLTEFEDDLSPRPFGNDVKFVASQNQDPVERPTRIVYTARTNAAGRAGFAIFAASILGVYLLMRVRFVSKHRV